MKTLARLMFVDDMARADNVYGSIRGTVHWMGSAKPNMEIQVKELTP